MNIKVKLTKIGNNIKLEIPFKMFCNSMKSELPRSMTYQKTDLLFKSILGNVDSSFKKCSTIFKTININQIYDKCDSPRLLN